MRQDSFERFYYEKVSLEGCGCAEYVSTRLRDLDGLAVNAEVRGIAWITLPERRSAWARLAESIRKMAEMVELAAAPPFHGPSIVSGSGGSPFRDIVGATGSISVKPII